MKRNEAHNIFCERIQNEDRNTKMNFIHPNTLEQERIEHTGGCAKIVCRKIKNRCHITK